LTLAGAARDYHVRVIEPTRTEKHGAQWIASLENHVSAVVWKAPIDSITPPQLLDALSGVRALEDKAQRIPETLQRVRQRLDSIFEDAMFHGRCTLSTRSIRRPGSYASFTASPAVPMAAARSG
jgi:hypothetical protein